MSRGFNHDKMFGLDLSLHIFKLIILAYAYLDLSYKTDIKAVIDCELLEGRE